MHEQVVVTGVGIISAIGIGRDDFWNNALQGKSGISEITLFDTAKYNCHLGGEIKNFNPQRFISRRILPFLGRASQFAIAAIKLALHDACLSQEELKDRRSACVIGATIPEGSLIDYSSETMLQGKADTITKPVLLNIFAPSIAMNVGRFFNIQGNNILIPCACAAGNYAISYGFDLIRKGKVDLAIVGGAEALSRIAFQGFQKLYAMSPDTCSPFDKNRKGMLLGEGAGFLILESLTKAKQRQTSIYAQVLGYGLSCDAFHITIPDKKGVKKAMENGLDYARISAQEVDYISAHGTGTQANDKAESAAIKELFAPDHRRIAVSSVKSMLGHCMGAASSIEAAVCCLALKTQMVPPTINYATPDPECDIDCVPNESRKMKLNIVLNNGFAFGGNNCIVVFSHLN